VHRVVPRLLERHLEVDHHPASEPLASDARILNAPNTVLSPHVAWFSTTSGPRVRRDTVEAMIVWIQSATVPHGNLAAKPSRPRDEATAEGVS
jgi:phosphoglycerate dehydrogenase-like enzyme